MSIPELLPQQAVALLKTNPAAKLIDVRTDEEYQTAKIKDAILVNTQEAMDPILAWPKETPIIVHCHHGFRSMQACGYLQSKGFTNVMNLAGGIDAWSTDVDPSVPQY